MRSAASHSTGHTDLDRCRIAGWMHTCLRDMLSLSSDDVGFCLSNSTALAAAAACSRATAVYELKGTGLDGKEKLFQKPWAMTTTMFIGVHSELLCVTYMGRGHLSFSSSFSSFPSSRAVVQSILAPTTSHHLLTLSHNFSF